MIMIFKISVWLFVRLFVLKSHRNSRREPSYHKNVATRPTFLSYLAVPLSFSKRLHCNHSSIVFGLWKIKIIEVGNGDFGSLPNEIKMKFFGL